MSKELTRTQRIAALIDKVVADGKREPYVRGLEELSDKKIGNSASITSALRRAFKANSREAIGGYMAIFARDENFRAASDEYQRSVQGFKDKDRLLQRQNDLIARSDASKHSRQSVGFDSKSLGDSDLGSSANSSANSSPRQPSFAAPDAAYASPAASKSSAISSIVAETSEGIENGDKISRSGFAAKVKALSPEEIERDETLAKLLIKAIESGRYEITQAYFSARGEDKNYKAALEAAQLQFNEAVAKDESANAEYAAKHNGEERDDDKAFRRRDKFLEKVKRDSHDLGERFAAQIKKAEVELEARIEAQNKEREARMESEMEEVLAGYKALNAELDEQKKAAKEAQRVKEVEAEKQQRREAFLKELSALSADADELDHDEELGRDEGLAVGSMESSPKSEDRRLQNAKDLLASAKKRTSLEAPVRKFVGATPEVLAAIERHKESLPKPPVIRREELRTASEQELWTQNRAAVESFWKAGHRPGHVVTEPAVGANSMVRRSLASLPKPSAHAQFRSEISSEGRPKAPLDLRRAAPAFNLSSGKSVIPGLPSPGNSKDGR